MKFHLLIEILKSLGRIEADLRKIEVHMSATDDKLAALVAAVSRTATDVSNILERLKSTGGLTADQTTVVDQAITGLGALDDAMEAAAAPAAHKAGPKH